MSRCASAAVGLAGPKPCPWPATHMRRVSTEDEGAIPRKQALCRAHAFALDIERQLARLGIADVSVTQIGHHEGDEGVATVELKRGAVRVQATAAGVYSRLTDMTEPGAALRAIGLA